MYHTQTMILLSHKNISITKYTYSKIILYQSPKIFYKVNFFGLLQI